MRFVSTASMGSYYYFSQVRYAGRYVRGRNQRLSG